MSTFSQFTPATSGLVRGIQGVEKVIKNIQERKKKAGEAVERGIKKAGLFLQRESMKLVPVDYGVLKASAYTRAKGSGFETKVTVGYTAYYAIYVHEAVEMKLKGQPRPPPHHGHYWDPQGRGQAKFLEEPMRRLRPQLLHIIKEEAKKFKERNA
jgi:hypothetical protein